MSDTRVRSLAIAAVLLFLPSALSSAAQAPTDSPAAAAFVARAKQAAGTEWLPAFEFICARSPNRANSPNDPVIEPRKIQNHPLYHGFEQKLARLHARRPGAATRNVFANDVLLVEVVPTPGSGIEPGLAFTVSPDGRVSP
ncbi:MAG: hypothetical protein HYU37_06405 [Acidobacteria bacterium]|nr:hypothetical protein [Acidobacteriota bacterium]